MLDLLIRGGNVVSLTVPGAGPAEAARVVDARGMYVLPGGIDAHVRFGIQFPAFTVPLADKLMGQAVDNVTGGNNGVEIRLPIMYSEGVSKGRISVNRMVALTSTNPAKVFGMYPKKGFIGPGGDADVVVIDPNLRKTITLADLHSACDYTAWEGWEFHGYPVMTVARGNIVMESGRFLGTRGAGEFIPRTLSPEVLAGPAVT